MRVTFDSNTWEELFSDSDFGPGIIKAIRSKLIEPYICEINLSLESICKEDRLPYHAQYSPLFNHTYTPKEDGWIQSSIRISPDLSDFPEPHPVLLENLQKAFDLGFKMLPMTNFGTARFPATPKGMKIEFADNSDMETYKERLGECSRFINSLGCGSFSYFEFKKEHKLNTMSLVETRILADQVSPKLFSKMIAEWADGDALSAHFAVGNQIFCTRDSAKSAGTRSVFSIANKNSICSKFNIKIMSPTELLSTLNLTFNEP